jgi:DNA polymerase-1
MSETIALIDADVFVYRVGLAIETPIEWGDGIWTLHADLDQAKQMLDDRIENVRKALDADRVEVALSCSTKEGFRFALLPTYKSNRKATRKPIIHGALREYLLATYTSYEMPTLEADDILGILATQPDTGETRVICSVDKDFKTLPEVPFYDLNTEKTTVATRKEAYSFFMAQVLAGDSVDGYKGCPKIGMITAAKLLAPCTSRAEMWAVIVKAYEKAGLNEAEALLNARMARILTWDDWNMHTQKLTLWEAPKLLPVAEPETK